MAVAGLTDQVEIIEGDIFHLKRVKEQFDYVLAEAILTMQSAAGKAKILAGISDRLKPNGQFLSHELRIGDADVKIIYRDLSTTIRVNAAPLPAEDWIIACRAAGLTVEQHDIGPMTLLNLRRIAQEEGVPTLLTIGWNSSPALYFASASSLCAPSVAMAAT